MRILSFALWIASMSAGDDRYADPDSCATCHADISRTYRQTGMARSFSRVKPHNDAGEYYHQPSARHYRIYRRGSSYYQRRWQIGMDGTEENVIEREIHFVLGSGNHARTYLHRTAQGKLMQMPVSWYAEHGGFGAMSPGYDRPDHPDFRREITYECMFCHNGYPQIESGGDLEGRPQIFAEKLPEGIDCQRCHGPGTEHVASARRGSPRATIQQAILNPAKLTRQRQLEVCLQCHLETTSRRLPGSLRRFGRGVFSYDPREPLSSYVLYFDHAPGTGRDDKFEIDGAAYRLMQSACFRRGSLTCTTCHNPHDVLRGARAAEHFREVCRSCHEGSLRKLIATGAHPSSTDCVGCHMPRRRTEDVVHVVMTDHLIQRRQSAADLVAARVELNSRQAAYTGEVRLYYPTRLDFAADRDLYVGLAQVKEDANPAAGIPLLRRALDRYRPAQAEFYYELAEAYRKTGNTGQAESMCAESLRRKPDFLPALLQPAITMLTAGNLDAARKSIERGLRAAPRDPVLLSCAGELYRREGRLDEAVAALRRAISLDPEMPETLNTLGAVLLKKDSQAAEAALRQAILLQPDLAQAHSNLAFIFSSRDDVRMALYHLQQAIRAEPDNAAVRLNYATELVRSGQLQRAREQLEASARLSPEFSRPLDYLGDLQQRMGDFEGAVLSYRRACELAPDSFDTHRKLGELLAGQGRRKEALEHLLRAAESPIPEVRDAALHLIQGLTQAR